MRTFERRQCLKNIEKIAKDSKNPGLMAMLTIAVSPLNQMMNQMEQYEQDQKLQLFQLETRLTTNMICDLLIQMNNKMDNFDKMSQKPHLESDEERTVGPDDGTQSLNNEQDVPSESTSDRESNDELTNISELDTIMDITNDNTIESDSDSVDGLSTSEPIQVDAISHSKTAIGMGNVESVSLIALTVASDEDAYKAGLDTTCSSLPVQKRMTISSLAISATSATASIFAIFATQLI